MKKLFGQAITILFARGFTRLSQFVAFLILGRFLTPEEFGWFGIVTTAVALAALLGSLGLRQSLAYKIGRNEITTGEATGTALLAWPLLMAAASTVVFQLYGGNLPGLSQWEAGVVITISISGAMLVMILQGIFLGRGEIRAFSTIETLPRVLLAVFACGLAILAAVSFSFALWAQALSYAVVVPLALFFSLRSTTGLSLGLRKLPSMIRYGIGFAINLFLISLCSRISLFVIERFWGANEAGQFFAAVRVNEIFLEAATTFGLVLFSDSARSGEDDTIPRRNARIACWTFWAFVVGGCLVFFLAPHLIVLLIGSQYLAAGDALRYLALSLGPAAASKVVYPTLAGQGRPWFGTPVIILSLAVNVGLAFLLVPKFGAAGGAMALAVGQYVLYAGYAVSCSRLFNIRIADFIVPRRKDIVAVSKLVRLPRPRKAPGESG